MSDLDRLFYWRGIASDFYNFRGQLTQVPIANRVKILEAMGVDTSTPQTIAQAAFDLDVKPWLNWLMPLVLAIESEAYSIDINFHPQDLQNTVSWSASQSQTLISSSDFNPLHLAEVGDYEHAGVRYSRRRLILPALEPGYYDFCLSQGSRKERSQLAVVPSTTYQSPALEQQAKPWGFVIQLYSLRSVNNWGIGDFGDLAALVRHAANNGAGVIGLNPFHALQTNLEYDVSPYSPSDRRFLNALYINVPGLTEFSEGVMDEADHSKIQILRESHLVNYSEVRGLKYAVLHRCFLRYIEISENRKCLQSFLRSSGPALKDFISYEARENWQPETTSSTELKSVAAGLGLNEVELFYLYLQERADAQLKNCQELASELSMSIGLIRDLAVGASGGGAEVQSNAELFCRDVSIGAPPDPLALTGQNWGMPPLDPAELRSTGFQHYIHLLRANMAHCGALRIDHAMSMMRLWWCPPDEKADKGCYIYYPLRELVGLLCLESHLNKCIIIGEDLGIVPDEFRAMVAKTKIYSNRVFYFEKWHENCFKHPKEYESHALAMVNNHDVPTLRSWWNATDLHLRNKLELLEEHVAFSDLLSTRQLEKQNLLDFLEGEGLLPDSWQDRDVDKMIDFTLILSILRLVSLSASKVLIIQLEDLLAMDEPVNVPGTYNEYPNWRRKLDRNLDEIFESKEVIALFADVSAARS
jgi:4-alpha-glucanotransferase